MAADDDRVPDTQPTDSILRLESGTDRIKYRMPFLPSANIAWVSYWPWVPLKLLATEYPVLKSEVGVNFFQKLQYLFHWICFDRI